MHKPLIFLALFAACNIHTAAEKLSSSSESTKKFTIEEKHVFFERAVDTLRRDNSTTEFKQTIDECPEIVRMCRYPESATTLLDCSMTWHVQGNDQTVFIKELLQRGAELTPNALTMCLSFVCASICHSHDSDIFEKRLKALTTFYLTVEAAVLPPELMTETIETPQQWLQQNALYFLKPKEECSECNISWHEHAKLNPGRVKQLREALQLDKEQS